MTGELLQKNKQSCKFSTKSSQDTISLAYQFHIKANALRLAGFYKKAASRYLNAILIDRKNADSYYGLGLCYKNLNKIQKAIEAFEKAQKIRELDYNICYELGLCYLISGNIASAIKNLINSIKLNSQNINAQIQLAIAHEIAEEEDMALIIYQKIIETSPEDIKAYNHKSTLLMTMGNYYEASVILHQILKINPEYYRAYLGIAICFDKMNKKNDAIRYYKKFIEYKPNSYHIPDVKERLAELKEISDYNSRSNNLILLK